MTGELEQAGLAAAIVVPITLFIGLLAWINSAGGSSPISPTASLVLSVDNPDITHAGQPFTLTATVQGTTIPDGIEIDFQMPVPGGWETFTVAMSNGSAGSCTSNAFSTTATTFRAIVTLPDGTVLTSNTVTLTTHW